MDEGRIKQHNDNNKYFDLETSVTEAMEVKNDDAFYSLGEMRSIHSHKISPLRLKRLDTQDYDREDRRDSTGERWTTTCQTRTTRESRKDTKICKSSKPTENKNKKTKTEPLCESDYDNMSPIFTDNSSAHSIQYERKDILGTGGFAKVYMVTERQSRYNYADKVTSLNILKRRNNAEEKIQREIKIHRSLDHANIVQFHSYFTHKNFIHMIMEVCTNKTILHVLKYRTTVMEAEARYYVRQIMEGTRYLHLKQILHRDLKLGNMFLHHDMTVKIGDFGLATTFSGNTASSMCGTPNYIAPEVLNKKGHGIESDIWAIGCMLYAMLCGNPPFETESLNATYKKIQVVDFHISSSSNISRNARNMIKMMLSKDPDSRGHLSMPDRYQDEGGDLFFQPFLQDFTPRSLPSSAIRSVPDLEKEKLSQMENSGGTRAMTINTRRETLDGNRNSGSGSLSPLFSPVFSPPQIGSALRQKFGTFFEKRGNFGQRIIDALTMIVEQGSRPGQPAPQPVHSQLPIFITKWVDYSNKFGFGYQLSNAAVGLVFLDTTRIGCTENRTMVEFLDMKGKTFTFPLKGPNPFNKEMQVRVKVLECVMDYMENNLSDAGASLQGLANVTTSGKTLIPHMKRWGRRLDWMTFELNNHTIQMNNFQNHSKMILYECGGELYLTIIEQNKDAITYMILALLNSNCSPSLLQWLNAAITEIKSMAEKE